MKWQKIYTGVVCGALTSEILILSIVSADNELIAKLPSMHEPPHTHHPNYRIPEYSNITYVMSSTGTVSSTNVLFDYPSF